MLRSTILSAALAVTLTTFTQQTAIAEVDFAKQVQPIFMEHCAGCHGEKKSMGKLSLHSPEAIQEKWEKDDHLIVKGKPDESELFERLVLPADHKKRMPKNADPLPEDKISTIRKWIEEGAAFPVIATAPPAADEEATAAETQKSEEPKELPLPEVDPADDAAIEKLTATGAQVTPLFADSPLLQVSYALRGEPATDADLALLTDLAPQIYSLNLAKAQISDRGLAVLAKLKNLSQLHLENSTVRDNGLSHLSGLERLQYLNLYATDITDAGLKFLEGLPNLHKLYVWQTKVSYDAAQQLEKQVPALAVSLGFDHPVIVRQRVTKELALAKEQEKEAEAEFEKVKAEFERVQSDREATKKRLEELQKKMDELDGKAPPAEKQDEAKVEENKA